MRTQRRRDPCGLRERAAMLGLALGAAACGASAMADPSAPTGTTPTATVPPADPGQGPACEPDNLTECRERCGKGEQESCFSLATLVQRGSRAGGPEESEYVPILQRTCDDKSAHTAEACGRLAYVLWISPNLKNLIRARELGTKACDLGGSLGCIFLAREDTQRPWAERARLFERGCTLGDMDGCAEAGVIAVEGRDGVPQDTARGLQRLDDACGRSDAASCAHLYFLYERGTVKSGRPTAVTPDKAKRDAYKTKYCALGVTGHGVTCAP